MQFAPYVVCNLSVKNFKKRNFMVLEVVAGTHRANAALNMIFALLTRMKNAHFVEGN
jgi:hypothetical protein